MTVAIDMEKGVRLSIITVGLSAGVAALYFGRAVFEPLAFALFIIALSAPLMQRLQPRIGKGLALVTTALVTIAIITAFFAIVVWGVLQIGDWVVLNMGRFQAVYGAVEAAMDGRGVPMESLMPERFDPRWVLGPLGALVGQLRLISGFVLLIFVFVILGLTELEGIARRLRRIEAERPGMQIGAVTSDVAAKFGRYMKVRLVISTVDSVVCYAFFRLIGLDEPLAWAVLVGALNFIPFIGPLIVAIFIGFFAAAQFNSLWMVFVAVGGTTAINFVLGSYIEPLMAGSALSMSAILVLFSVFFWAIIWGIPGAFIGVQITIVILAICRVLPSASWIADLFSGDGAEARVARE
jgi:AI-2 transport protein TqsA